MKKIIDELINSSISGVDVYRYKDATWLIFTDEGRWVVELTDEGTLWYNYKFFNDVFKYVSMTVGKEMEGYVIQWVNDFFYKGFNEVNDSSSTHRQNRADNLMTRIIQGGIKNTYPDRNSGEYDWSNEFEADKVIERGVKL